MCWTYWTWAERIPAAVGAKRFMKIAADMGKEGNIARRSRLKEMYASIVGVSKNGETQLVLEPIDNALVFCGGGRREHRCSVLGECAPSNPPSHP